MKKGLLTILLGSLLHLTACAQQQWTISALNAGAKGGYIENVNQVPNTFAGYNNHFPGEGFYPTFYVHFPKGHFEVKSLNNARVEVTDCFKEKVLLRNASARKFTFTATHEGWYRLALTGGKEGEQIRDFTVSSDDARGDKNTAASNNVYLANWRSVPSLHLNGFASSDPQLPEGDCYDWIYNEVQIPEDADFVGTYVEAFGFTGGYIGMQNNSNPQDNDRHDIIFSVWDSGDTDADPNLAGFKRSGTITWGKAKHVVVERFGGEGTGGHVLMQGPQWKAGKWVQFLLNVRPEEIEIRTKDQYGQDSTFNYTNTIVSAWYRAQGVDDKWHFIACHRQAGTQRYFGSGFNAFLEEYTRGGSSQGYRPHKGYYRRVFTHDMMSGKWFNRNNFWFGHTDGGDAIGARGDHYQTALDDYQGEAAMYMQSGGYTATKYGKTNIPLMEPEGIVPTDAELDSLYRAEVLPAIQKQDAQRIDLELNETMEAVDMSQWKVISVSSEETSGENAPATNVLDGNDNTFWHTKWNGITDNYPYTLVIGTKDGKKVNKIKRIQLIQPRVGKKYAAAEVKVEKSYNNGESWSPVGVFALNKEVENNLVLKYATSCNALRFTFTKAYEGCNQFLCLGEIKCYKEDNKAVIAFVKNLFAKENQFNGYATKDLQGVRDAYNDGKGSIKAIIRALKKLGEEGRLIKYFPVKDAIGLSSDRCYSIFNAFGYGTMGSNLSKTDLSLSGALPTDGAYTTPENSKPTNVLDPLNNWMIIALPNKEKYGEYYLYNVGAKKYLNLKTMKLQEEPSRVFVSKNEGDKGFTICEYSRNSNALTVNPEKNGVDAFATNYRKSAGSMWVIYDNFNLRPSFELVNTLRKETGNTTGNEGTTGIEEVMVQPSDRQGIYNLEGKKVKDVERGNVYVVNGKKVVR